MLMKKRFKKFLLLNFILISLSSNVLKSSNIIIPDNWEAVTNIAKESTGFDKLLPIKSILSLDLPSFNEIINTLMFYASTASGHVKTKCLMLVNWLKIKKFESLTNSINSNNNVTNFDTSFENAWTKSVADSFGNLFSSVKAKALGLLGCYVGYRIIKYAFNKIKNKVCGDSSCSQQNSNIAICINGENKDKDKEALKKEILEKIHELLSK